MSCLGIPLKHISGICPAVLTFGSGLLNFIKEIVGQAHLLFVEEAHWQGQAWWLFLIQPKNERIAPAIMTCLVMKLPSKPEAICEVEWHEQLVPLPAECQGRRGGLLWLQLGFVQRRRNTKEKYTEREGNHRYHQRGPNRSLLKKSIENFLVKLW